MLSILCVSLAACVVAAPDTAKEPAFPFYAFCVGTGPGTQAVTYKEEAALLADLGYDGVGHLWLDGLEDRLATLDAAGLKLYQVYLMVNVAPDAEAYDPRLKEALPLLTGRDVALALLMQGLPPSDAAGDARAVEVVREIADLAASVGAKVTLYPHVDCWLERVDDALRVARKAERQNVGVMFNLCHWLKGEQGKELEAVLERALPLLHAASIHGADNPEAIADGTGNWLQPLGEGSFNTAHVIHTLRNLGYRGPVGLQCYGIPGDARAYLTQSMASWSTITEKRHD